MLKFKFNKNTPKIISPKGLVGININENNLYVSYSVTNGDQITIKKIEHFPIKDEKEITKYLREFVNNNKLSGAYVNYVVNPKDYYFGLTEYPKASEGDISTQLEKLAEDVIDYSVKEASIDCFKLPKPRANDNSIMGYIVSIKQKKIEEIINSIHDSGLIVKYIDIPELVLRNIIFLHPDNENGCMFLYLNKKGGNIILFKNGELYITRSMEILLDKFLSENITEENINSYMDDESLEKLALELQRSMDYCSSLLRMYIASSIVLPPSELSNNLLSEYLKQSMGMPVNLLNLEEFINFEVKTDKLLQANSLFAIGASLRDYIGVKSAATN